MGSVTKIIENKDKVFEINVSCEYIVDTGLVTELEVYHLSRNDDDAVLVYEKKYAQKGVMKETMFESGMIKSDIIIGIRNYERELSKINTVLNWDGNIL